MDLRIRVLCSAALICLLSGCTVAVQSTAPLGVQTATGVLLPATLSTQRSGTHVLMQGTRPLYYVESASINLRDFEQKDVKIRGMAQANIAPGEAPLLTAREIIALPTAGMNAWNIPALHLSVEVPQAWDGTFTDDIAIFRVSGSETGAVLTIANRSDIDLSTLERIEKAGGRTVASIILRGKRAIRSVDQEKHTQLIAIDRGLHPTTYAPLPLVILSFTPPRELSGREFNDVVLAVLPTISLAVQPSSTPSSMRTGSGSTGSSTTVSDGAPCGGTAGVLCPSGMFCEITDRASNVGRCKRTK